jgi:HEAT repeat protein
MLSFLSEGQSEELRAASLDALDSFARDDERVARAIADAAAKDPSFEVRKKAVNLLMPKFDFVVPTFVAALDDPNPQVRLTAGNKLAWLGMTDDRTVPALCHAALKADDVTKEGIGLIFSQLILDRPNDQTPDDQLKRNLSCHLRRRPRVP